MGVVAQAPAGHDGQHRAGELPGQVGVHQDHDRRRFAQG